MILKRRVSLGGVQLDSLDNRILISGIDEAAGRDSITGIGSGGNGQRITKKKRESLDITVKFTLKIRSDEMAEREALLQKIIGWAAPGGWLRLESRPGQRLMVTLAQAPGSGDMFNWANEFTMVFRAYSVPFWMESTAVSAKSGTAAEGSMTIDVPGNAESVADATIENRSGKTINRITLKVGNSEIKFTDLNLGGTDTLYIEHTIRQDIAFFRARTGNGGSVMAKRSGADDLKVNPGVNAITFSADRAVAVTVNVRGRYL